jgi:hypothetical protein
MRETRKTALVRVTVCLAAASLTVLAACGEDDFENNPRPAVAVELTGVIQEDKVTVSPDEVGAGPISITIANETDSAHTVTLEGERIRERVGPINPQDTATLQKTLATGKYEVRAGSEQAVPKEIRPAELTIGEPRPNSNDELLLP